VEIDGIGRFLVVILIVDFVVIEFCTRFSRWSIGWLGTRFCGR